MSQKRPAWLEGFFTRLHVCWALKPGFEAKRMMFLIVDWLPPGDTHFLKLCFYPFIG